MIDTSKVTRIEVINHHVKPSSEEYGRAYTYWPEGSKKPEVEVQLQDGGKTLKVFVK